MSQNTPLLKPNRSILRHLNTIIMVRNLWANRELLRQLIIREVNSRYRGSFLGLIWAFLQPLGDLLVYTTVFGLILKGRWGENATGVKFALTMFSGLMVFEVFSGIILQSSTLIANNTVFVKKVIFPLEILPLATLGSSLVNLAISMSLFSICSLIVIHKISLTILFFPLIILPLFMLVIGISWFVASLGVFMRDLGQIMTILMRFFFFATPVFYPKDQVPDFLQWILVINPMAFLVEQARRTLVWNQQPEWPQLILITLVSLVIMQLGYVWFMETKRGFADVV